MKLRSRFALLLGISMMSAISLTGCKEDDPEPDPNIRYKTLSVTVVNNTTPALPEIEQAFDIDNDGTNDFKLKARYEDVGGDTSITSIDINGLQSDNEVMYEIQTFPPSSMTSNKVKALSSGSSISSSAAFSEDAFAVLSASISSTVVASFGFTDGTDKLIGVRFAIGSATHYAWLKVNVSSDLKTMKVKECAYHIVPGTAIAAGAK